MALPTLLELWHDSTDGTVWSTMNVTKELNHVEGLARRPRIPADHLIFRVFRAFQDPQRQIKVVLLGQDPYPEVLHIPDPTQPSDDPRGEEVAPKTAVSRACGFSFSSPLGNLPKSLQTVFSEILREYPQPPVQEGKRAARAAKTTDYSGDLSYLVADGVFLLNTFLTIRMEEDTKGPHGIPKSHTSWLVFTTQVLNFIRRTCPNAVFLAFGRPSADLMKASGITDAIETDHPASRIAGRNPFRGSNVFIRANEILVKRGVVSIDWIPMKTAVDTKYYEVSRAAPRSRIITPALAAMLVNQQPKPQVQLEVSSDEDEDEYEEEEIDE